jgi:hypothetical protein
MRERNTSTQILAMPTRRFFTPDGLELTDEQRAMLRYAVAPGAQSDVPRREPPPAVVP